MKFYLVLIAILFIPSFGFTQDRFDFQFDYAQFAFDSESNYVEFYYSFGQNSLIKTAVDDKILLEGIFAIQILDSASLTKIVDKEWRISHHVFALSESDRSLIGVVSFILPAGTYQCIVGGRDSANSLRGKSYTEFFTIKPFIGDHISISDLQLASKIFQDSPDSNSIFFKNTYEVVPLPTSVFGENQPVLFHYFELYNLHEIEHDGPVKLNTVVLNSKGIPVFRKTKPIQSIAPSRVEVGSVVLNKLPTDTYTLLVSLIDSIGNYGVSSSKKFYVFNPSVEPPEEHREGISDALLSHFGVLAEEEMDDLFEKSTYIATSRETEQYKKLSSLDAKREFLFQFWKARDNSPGDSRNDYFIAYMKRIDISNQRYSTLGKAGRKTDRGRVFITYGEPNDIERYPSQIDVRPYEIWHYHEMEGGVVFIFADITGLDYLLVHSTLRGELRDDAWLRRIQIR